MNRNSVRGKRIFTSMPNQYPVNTQSIPNQELIPDCLLDVSCRLAQFSGNVVKEISKLRSGAWELNTREFY